MLTDIISVKDNVVFKRKKKNCVDVGGISDSWLDVRKRGGGSFRCVLCATGGWGGLKIGKKCVCN